jgi:hypothetical protein
VLVGALDRGHGGGGRQDRDDHGAVCGGLDLERERGEQREADDDARRHDRQRPRLLAGRQRRARDEQVDGGQGRGHGGAPEGHEPRVEVGDREPRRREREREADDAEGAEQQARGQHLPARSRRACRYRRNRDSVIGATHAKR